MPPITRASSKMKANEQADDVQADDVLTDAVQADDVLTDAVQPDQAMEDCASTENVPKSPVKNSVTATDVDESGSHAVSDDPNATSVTNVDAADTEPTFNPNHIRWFRRYIEIEQKIMKESGNPATEFVRTGWTTFTDGSCVYYYWHNGALFRCLNNGQPWPWPVVQVDPATVGIPYDPDTNAADALRDVLVALPHGQLYKDAVYIKNFCTVDSQIDSRDKNGVPVGELFGGRWVTEVRALELLSRKHPHPNLVRYLGCRVIDVPVPVAGAVETTVKIEKRITGIVLEKLSLSMADYDADEPRFRAVAENTDLFLTRLETVVHYLHSVGLAHNDLKPSNVMLRGTDGQPVLIDLESCVPLGTKMEVGGTRDWCEKIEKDKISCVENDLYALRLFRERIGEKDAVLKYFRYH
ncbi:hypothetical protein SCUCBS95973_001489 [Sporothrix curviconia]|uniref:Protein kinase domain-containing protein n=1 Tax=Sporothrix curviconia TaxID=1260050 RepID=A0ABP0AZ20_9PEZI